MTVIIIVSGGSGLVLGYLIGRRVRAKIEGA